jgi:hypothetical protein
MVKLKFDRRDFLQTVSKAAEAMVLGGSVTFPSSQKFRDWHQTELLYCPQLAPGNPNCVRCSAQSSGRLRRDSVLTVRSEEWRPSRMASRISGARKAHPRTRRSCWARFGLSPLTLHRAGFLEGTEDTVSADLSAHPPVIQEVKSGSQSLRFVIANNSPIRFAKSDLSSGLRETCDRTACHYSAMFSPARLSEKLSQNTGNFICFVGDSVIFLYGGD